MTDMTGRRREPKGLPTGGRFAREDGAASDASDLKKTRPVLRAVSVDDIAAAARLGRSLGSGTRRRPAVVVTYPLALPLGELFAALDGTVDAYVIRDPLAADELFRAVAAKPFPTISDAAGERMQRLILSAREAQDSAGGIVECAAIGLPAGLGDPMFDGMENRLASALFGIPAVKGVEFGAGFGASRLRGSENNDAFRVEDGRIVTETNRAGGILGGITTGMPLTLRVGIKPTPSIGRPQKTVSLARMENTELTIRGRHDPCIAHRAVPVVEAVTACVLLDLLLEEHHGTF